MSPTTLYTAVVTARGGRDGSVESSDGTLTLALAAPTEMGGAPTGSATNPEQLFAAGYSACFESALRLVSRGREIDPGEIRVTAHVALTKDDADGFGLEVRLDGAFSKFDDNDAQHLMSAAHQVCPYSKAVSNAIPVTLAVQPW